MKFTVNYKPFLNETLPVVEVAGKSFKKYDVEKYLAVTPHLIDELNGLVNHGIEAALSKFYVPENYKSLRKAKNSIKSEVCAGVTADMNRLRRVTIDACKNRITISGSNGASTITHNISGDSLLCLNYHCEREGNMTVESGQLWKMLQSISKYDRIVLESDCDCRVTIHSEQKGASRTFEKLANEIKPISVYKVNTMTRLNSNALAKGIKDIIFIQGKNVNQAYRHLVMELSGNRVRLMCGDGGFFAIKDIYFESEITPRTFGVEISHQVLESLVSALMRMKGDVELCFSSMHRKKTWELLIKQEQKVFSFPVKCYRKEWKMLEGFIDYKYKFKAFTKVDIWKTLFDTKRSPYGISRAISTTVNEDFVNGVFHVVQGNEAESEIPFYYGSEVLYSDLSVNDGKVSFSTSSINLVRLFKRTHDDDILSFEFGINGKLSKKRRKEMIKELVVARFPMQADLHSKIKHQLTVIIPNDDKM